MTNLPRLFWAKVDMMTGDCWIWTGHRNETGYGRYGNGETRAAHRLAYMDHVGPIPDGLTIDHLCNNPSCVRPDHMEVVTRQENLHRKQERRYGGRDLCKFGHPLEYATENADRRTCRICRKASWAASWQRRSARMKAAA